MDDTVPTSQQPPVQQPVDTSTAQPTGQAVPPASMPQQQVSITPGKEQAPVSVESNVAPVETLPKIPPEVKEAGVEAIADRETLDLKLEDQKAGFSAQNEATPVSTSPSNTVQFPIAEDEAKKIVSRKDTKNSLTWLAALIIRQAKIIHQKLFSQQL